MKNPDCTVIYFDGNFKERLKKQRVFEQELIKKHGRNRFQLIIEDNCFIALHPSERELINR